MDETAARSRARLPDLGFLPGFEAAARHGSFTRAASELFLTQSAISRQVLTLESQLGTPLFERKHRALELTPAGRVLQVAARRVLEEMARATSEIRGDTTARPVTISTAIPFAALWLVPRLRRFRERHPEHEVFISADNRILDLGREGLDLAIRYCLEASAPPGAERLFGERLQPVAAPSLARDRKRALRKPADLAKHVLLHLDDEHGRLPWLHWDVWLAAQGVTHLRPQGSLRFNQYDLLIRAALDGQGVALGRSPLVDRLVAQGALVALFGEVAASSRAYYLVRSPRARGPAVDAFIAWLRDEAHATLDDVHTVAPSKPRRRSAT